MEITKEQNIGTIGTLKITKNLQKIIDYLHNKVGSTEWSGILFYKITKGSIDNLKNIEFTADFLYPMHIGTSTYTEYSFDGEVTNAYDIYPNALEMSMSHVHSHHSMQAFFSGTDKDELIGNAKHYNYYLSLIVNFSKEYCAKVALPSKSKIESKSYFKNSSGQLVEFTQEKEEDVILIGDLNVVIEGEKNAPKWLEERYVELKEKKIVPVYTANSYSPREFTPYQGKMFQDDFSGYPETNFRNNWRNNVDRTPKMFADPKVNSQNKSYQFLAALIKLDASKSNCDVSKALEELTTLAGDEIDQYDTALDANVEIIHNTVYGSDVDIRKHCLEALLELSNYEAIYGDMEVYDVINQTLGVYAV